MKYDLILKPGDTLSVTVPDVVVPEPPVVVPPIVVPPVTGKPLVGMYPGGAAANETAFETKLGKPVGMIAVHAGRGSAAGTPAANYADWNMSWQGAALNLKGNAAADKYSLPLKPDNWAAMNLALVTNAQWLDGLKRAAQNALANAPADSSSIYFRVGEEFNANWMNWSVYDSANKQVVSPDVFKAIMKAVKVVLASVSSRLKLVFCPMAGWLPWEAYYPGDDVVDVFGFDVYCNSWDTGALGGSTFEKLRDHPTGLNAIAKFAKARGKSLACDEWGVNDDQPDRVAFVTKFLAWCADNGLLYQTVFEEHETYRITSKPKSWAAYKAGVA